MIASNEVRIGNWVENENGYPILVNVNFFAMLERAGGKSSGTRGIPLTPEILEAVGWKKANEGCDYTKEKIDLLIYSDGNIRFKFNNRISQTINFVHQLQNLYFALSGEELEINIDKLQKEAV